MNSPANPSCALILLAAGASTRMGRPKQLLPVQGKPLLRYVVEWALAEPVSSIVIVLGANASEIAPSLTGLSAQVVVNPGWAEGMGSSLRCGLKALLATAPSIQNVIIALADQPDLPAGHLAKLIATRRASGRSITASEFEGVRGPPVLFTAKLFPELQALAGEAGARSLLQIHACEVETVPLLSARDIDTPADYSHFLERYSPAKE